jgi:hypothetical protein
MASIKLYTRNILETGTVTVTGTPDTGFPESRLYDRAISLFWKDTVVGAVDFHIDQGATTTYEVDFIAIEKHNFNGETLEWQWSVNNSDWNDAVTDWTQSDNLQIIKTISTALDKRYWQVTLTSMTNPKCSEIFMSYGREFDVIGNPSPIIDNLDNVRWNKTVGGIERSTKLGEERKVRQYSFSLDSTELTSFRAAMGELSDYSLPFYIKDTDDDYWMCRLLNVPREEPNQENTLTAITIDVIEML